MDDYSAQMFLAMTGQPGGLFGQAAGPAPPNVLGGLFGSNPLMAMAAQFGAEQLFRGLGMAPGDLFPRRNVVDQLEARAFWDAQRQAVAAAGVADTPAVSSLIQGMMRGVMGPLSPGQVQSANNVAGALTSYVTPLVAQMFPQTLDALGGARGMQQAFMVNTFPTFAQMVDPTTGVAGGMSGPQAAALARSTLDRLYGPTADLSAMHGVGAGLAGATFSELGRRGMLPGSIGLVPAAEQARLLSAPGALADLAKADPDALAAIAGRLEGRLTQLKGASAEDQARILGGAGEDVRTALDAMRSMQDPAYGAALRQFDGKRIADRLKELSGAVSAIRDVFGDSGNPNAPMPQLMAGLDALTQGGLTTMGADRVERSVRTTWELARRSNMGMDALMGLMAAGSQQVAAAGLDASFVPQVTQGAMGFGAAFAQLGVGATPNFFARDREKMTLDDQRLRARAAGSEFANSLGAAFRASDALQSAGVALTGPGAALLEAVNAGEGTFRFGGREQSVFMSATQMVDVLAESGMDRDAASRLVRDRTANQQSIQRHELGEFVRERGQPEEARRVVRQAEAASIAGGLLARDPRMNQDEAMARADRAADALSRMQMGEDVTVNGKTFKGLTSDERRDEAARNRRMAELLGAADPALGAMGEADRTLLAENMVGDLNERLKRSRAFSGYNALTIFEEHDRRTLARGRSERRAADDAGRIRSALDSVGRVGPLGRLADAIRAGGDFGKAASGVLGAIDLDDVQARLARGERLAANEELAVQMQGLSSVHERLKAAQAEQDPEKRAAAVSRLEAESRGILRGGDDATKAGVAALAAEGLTREQWDDVVAGRLGSPELQKQLRALGAARQGGGLLASADRAGLSTGVKLGPETAEEAAALLDRLWKGHHSGGPRPDPTAAPGTAARKAYDERFGHGKQLVGNVDTLLGGLAGDARALKALGKGGVGLVDDLQRRRNQLEDLAEERGQTVEQLLASGDAKALTIARGMTDPVREIGRRQRSGPGEAMDEAEGKRADELSARGKKPDAELNLELVKRLGDAGGAPLGDEEAKKLAERLGTGAAGRAHRAALERDLTGLKSLDSAAERIAGERGLRKEEVLEAARQGKLGGLTALSDKDRKELEAAAGSAGALRDYGAATAGGLGTSAAAAGRALDSYAAADPKAKAGGAGDAASWPKEMRLTGSVKIEDGHISPTGATGVLGAGMV